MHPIRVLLAEHYPLLLEGIACVLAPERDLAVVASCTTVADVLPLVERHRPDVVILDDDVAGDFTAVLRSLRSRNTGARIVLLSGGLKDAAVLEAIREGACGIVLKTMSADCLIECVRKVHGGATWLEAGSMGRALQQLVWQEAAHRTASAVLTPRELEVVRMVGARRTTNEIADSLSVCKGTVKVHFHNIYQKLGIKGRLELTLYARDNGLA